jgi:hypothetical protein
MVERTHVSLGTQAITRHGTSPIVFDASETTADRAVFLKLSPPASSRLIATRRHARYETRSESDRRSFPVLSVKPLRATTLLKNVLGAASNSDGHTLGCRSDDLQSPLLERKAATRILRFVQAPARGTCCMERTLYTSIRFAFSVGRLGLYSTVALAQDKS